MDKLEEQLKEIVDEFYEDVYSHRRRRVTNSGDRSRVKKRAITQIKTVFYETLMEAAKQVSSLEEK